MQVDDIESLAKHYQYKEYHREYAKRNREKRREAGRKHYALNKETILEAQKLYKKNNRQHFNELKNSRNRQNRLVKANEKWG